MKHFPEPTAEELAFVEESRRLGGVASTVYVPQVGEGVALILDKSP